MGGLTFRPELATAVMAGSKTVTRRLCSDNPRSPWWRERCGLTPGRALVVSVERKPLGVFDNAEVRREGFDGWAEFEAAWIAINGRYDEAVEVWRVELIAICEAVA